MKICTCGAGVQERQRHHPSYPYQTTPLKTFHHIAKEVYVPGSAADDTEQHSFPVREGVPRPLGEESLADQAPFDNPNTGEWADDVLAANGRCRWIHFSAIAGRFDPCW